MKQIENKQTEVPYEGAKRATYANLLTVIVSQPRQGGYSIQDIRIRTRILDVLEHANQEILLEEADYEYLKPLIKDMHWPVLNKELLSFTDDFDKIPSESKRDE